MRLATSLFLLLILAFAGWARETDPARLTLATYNVQWLTDVFDDPYTNDQIVPPKPRGEIEQIARAIAAADADVIALQEVENEGTLRAMVSETLADRGYRYVAVQATNSDLGQNLGLVSRLPIVSLTSHRFLDVSVGGDSASDASGDASHPRRFARDLAHARLRLPDGRILHVLTVHLKSKHDSPGDRKSAHWRLAEETTARGIIADLLAREPEALVALMGDFNDLPDSAPLQALLAPGSDGQALLVDVHAGLPANRRHTYLKDPYRTEGPIDYILASPALSRRLIAGSAVVETDAEILGGSDHAPVRASFDLGR